MQKAVPMESPVQLQSNEEITSVIRRHPVHLWGRLILILLIIILLLVLWFNWGMGSSGAFATLINIVAGVGIVGSLIAAYIYWFRYNNDVWMITNQRLVDSTRTTPFSHSVQTADLLNLQDISIRQRGVAQTMFQYGDVECQTASAGGSTFKFRGVADPKEVMDQIEDARSAARAGNRSSSSGV